MIECHCGKCERLIEHNNNILKSLKKYTCSVCKGCEWNIEHTWDRNRKCYVYFINGCSSEKICSASDILSIIKRAKNNE